jgi:hypothetical protein
MAELSSYNVFRRAGKTRGEYESNLRSLDEILSERAHKEQVGQVESQILSERLDTLMSAVELGSTIYGGYKDQQDFADTLSQVETATGQQHKIVGSEGKSWDDMNLLEKMFSEQKYQFGDRIVSKADVRGFGQLHKYGIIGDEKLKELAGVPIEVDQRVVLEEAAPLEDWGDLDYYLNKPSLLEEVDQNI